MLNGAEVGPFRLSSRQGRDGVGPDFWMAMLPKSPLGWFALILAGAALLLMFAGAVLQLAGGMGSEAYVHGIAVHHFGGWVLFAAFVVTFITINGARKQLGKWGKPKSHRDLDLRASPDPIRSLLQLLVAGEKELRDVIFAEHALTEEAILTLSRFQRIELLDLRPSEVDSQSARGLESLLRVETIWLRGNELPPRELRALQTALPACTILVGEGLPADYVGTIHADEYGL